MRARSLLAGGENWLLPTQLPIGRHQIDYHWLFNRGLRVLTSRHRELRTSERWELLHKSTYSIVLGLRLKRIREGRHLTQAEVIKMARKPNGGFYSQGFLSRIEGGYANAPLYSYVDFANAYELDPGRVMGPEESEKPVGGAEMALIGFLRRLGITPDEAMARIARGEPGRRS
jgi:transcriptional regulator with XRE-family HTH domain